MSPFTRTQTDQVDDTLRLRLVFGSLGEEKQTLASLRSMCGVGASDIGGFLAAKVISQVLVFDGLVAEPEKLLRVHEAPT